MQWSTIWAFGERISIIFPGNHCAVKLKKVKDRWRFRAWLGIVRATTMADRYSMEMPDRTLRYPPPWPKAWAIEDEHFKRWGPQPSAAEGEAFIGGWD